MQFLLKFCGRLILLKVFFISLTILLLDLFGIAIVFPFLNLFISPELIRENFYSNSIFELLRLKSNNQFIFLIGGILIATYITKFFLKTFLTFNRNKYLAEITYNLSSSIFKGLLDAKYSLFTENAPSEMINIVNAHTIHSVICLDSIIKVLNELAFLFVIIVIALYINPLTSLALFLILFVMGICLYFGLIKKISHFGLIHSKLNMLIYKYGYATASSIKDIKIMRLEGNYVDKFTSIWKEYSSNESKSKTAKSVPGDIAETIIFSGMILVCLTLIVLGKDIKELIPLLAVLAITAMRVLPSFNRIVSNYNEFKFYKPSLNLVEDLYNKINSNRQTIKHFPCEFTKEIKLENISFSYKDQLVLDSVSFGFKKGCSYGFVGTSGAGKSTLLDLIVGLREAKNGAFFLDGKKIDPFNTDALRAYIGYVPQNVNLIDESVAYNISFEHQYNEQALLKAIQISQLESFISELPNGLNTLVGESGVRVSGGQKQRIGVARALYRNPHLLIFDEATSALDTITERELMKQVNTFSASRTLLIVAHRLSTVEQCDEIYLLSEGKVVASGKHDDLLRDSNEYKNLYYSQMESLA